ncbi:hypothetical protein [Acidisoma sp. 7E03]
MRIIIERRRKPDLFNRLLGQTLRQPQLKAVEAWLARRPRLQRWLWFVGLYWAGVLAVVTVAFALTAIVPKH